MLDILGKLQSVLSHKQKPKIDNHVFKLHYRFTGVILVAFCLLITAYQYFGDPIDCVGTTDKIIADRQEVVDEFCWLQNTFILPYALNHTVGSKVISPGIAQTPVDEISNRPIESEKVYQSYYQWVCFVLFIQAAFFYIPHYIWKILEGDVMKGLANSDLQSLTVNEENRTKGINILITYYRTYLNEHQYYFIKFVVCEFLNFFNVVVQILITDKFLGGEFSTYGLDVIGFLGTDQKSRVDPMVKVFPKLTKCNFYIYGTGSDVRLQDVVCILPINIINEKIYVFLWFWFVILAVVSGIHCCYRLATIFVPRLRYIILSSRAKQVPFGYVDSILRNAKLGDWFFLYQLSKNMETYSFRQFVKELAESESDYPEAKKRLNSV